MHSADLIYRVASKQHLVIPMRPAKARLGRPREQTDVKIASIPCFTAFPPPAYDGTNKMSRRISSVDIPAGQENDPEEVVRSCLKSMKIYLTMDDTEQAPQRKFKIEASIIKDLKKIEEIEKIDPISFFSESERRNIVYPLIAQCNDANILEYYKIHCDFVKKEREKAEGDILL